MRLSTIPISAWIGIAGIVLSIFCAIFAPLIAPYGEREIVGSVWQPMGGDFLLGTDNLGREKRSRPRLSVPSRKSPPIGCQTEPTISRSP